MRGVLSDLELEELVASGVIENVTPELINGSSIDVTLGEWIMVEEVPRLADRIVEIGTRKGPQMRKVQLGLNGFILEPGECILGQTQQVFHLPRDISGDFRLKSTVGRMFLEHLMAGWCDPGWHGSVLTLELVNVSRFHHIRIKTGDRIGQVVFFRHTPVSDGRDYSKVGRYNGDMTVTEAKQNRLDP